MRNVPTEIILMEICLQLQNMAANPDLSAKIKEAYALSESEKEKSAADRLLMAQADQFRAELKKREEALFVINERIKTAEDLDAKNTESLHALERIRTELDQQKKSNDRKTSENEAEAKRLEKLSSKLRAQQESLDSSTAEVEQMKANLKKRVDKMKAETADL